MFSRPGLCTANRESRRVSNDDVDKNVATKTISCAAAEDKDKPWQYVPVETADEVMSSGDVIECAQLKNWNRWLKIRKQQQKHLGLMVCRSPASLVMTESDGFRSKVECRWMLDVAAKLKANGEHGCGPPHWIPREATRFTSVYVPDVVRAERGTFGSGTKRDARDGFELRTANRFMRDELRALNRCLRPAGSPGKLAVVGVAVRTLARDAEAARCHVAGPVPSIRVDRAPDVDDECGPTVSVRVNDFVAISNDAAVADGVVGEVCGHRTVGRAKPAGPIVPVAVHGECWDEVTVENRGEVTVRYGWHREERRATDYDDILVIGKRPAGGFYFDTRSGVLGPGQTVRLPVLFRPAVVGPCVETWTFRAHVLGRPEPVALVTLPLQGCGVAEPDDRVSKLQNAMLSKHVRTVCGRLTGAIVGNALSGRNRRRPESDGPDHRYRYAEGRMGRLSRALHRDGGPASVEDLLRQCVRLERSRGERLTDAVARTAVTLLRDDAVPGHGRMTGRELNAHKSVHVAVDCVDLLMATYEADYSEARRRSAANRRPVPPERGILADVPEEQTTDYIAALREEWLETMKPMIRRRLEWAVDRICDYDVLWPECEHTQL